MTENTGLSLRDLVLEVRSDVKELKSDLGARVIILEKDSIKTKAVATALLTAKKQRWSRSEKVLGVAISFTLVGLNILTLGPDLIKF